jgi:hypothetical protein
MSASSAIATLHAAPNYEPMSCARLALRAPTGMAGGRVDAAITQALANVHVPVDWNRINTKVWRAGLELLGFVVVRDDVPEAVQLSA